MKEHFSKHRCCGGANENADVQEFNRNALGIDVAGDDFDVGFDSKYKRKGARCWNQYTLFFYRAPDIKVAYFFKIFRANSCVAVAYNFKKTKWGIHRTSSIS